MNCDLCRLLQAFARRPEEQAGPEEQSLVRAHLTTCPTCRAEAEAEDQADQRLREAMQAVPTPPGLRDRLLSQLADQRRQERNRVARRWGVRVAVAASLLLAVGLTGFWVGSLRSPVDLASLSARLEHMPRTALEAEQALGQTGRPVQVPNDFDYALLVHCERTPFQGRLVPTLDFQTADCRAGAAVRYHARVFVLNDTEFDLKSLEALSQPPPAGAYNIDVRWSLDGRQAYLVVYTGGRLAPFLKPGAPPA